MDFTKIAKVAANITADIWQKPTARLLAEAGVGADEAIIHAEFDVAGNKYKNNYILVYPKELKLQRAQVETVVEGLNVKVKSPTYARGIYLSLDGDDTHHFSDNYFDLLPGEERTVSVATTLPPSEVRQRLRVMVYGSR